jgi:hypothetical protein
MIAAESDRATLIRFSPHHIKNENLCRIIEIKIAGYGTIY